MMAVEQVQSIDIYQVNSTVNSIFNENKDEIKLLFPDSTPPRQSRFFRIKRNQRSGENQANINEHTEIEVPSSDAKTPIGKLKTRSLSPPPSPHLSPELTDESDESNSSTKDDDIQKQYSSRSTLPDYQRRKAQSVKLTHINQIGSCPKKAVRFADDFGLELSQIKMITTDEFPFIPSTAFKYLQLNNHKDSSTLFNHQRMKVINYMEPQFESPIHTEGFNDRVSRQKVVLEQTNAIDNRIYGTVKLFSCSLSKRVKIRLTTDNWISFKDYDAIYIPNSFDGIYDRFSFTVEIDRHKIYIGNNIQFCICYESYGGPEYWDNNYQQNYRFNCCSRTIPDHSN